MKSYELIRDAPPAMQWQEYEQIIKKGWNSLLDDAPSERRVQQFLEAHPSLVPGPFGLIGTSGHSPYPAAIIAQPVLPDFTRKVPDFLWIARDSTSVYPILIEIEAPSKKWFTNTGQQTADLTQALGQLADWKTWFDKPRNVLGFIDHYQIDIRGAQLRPLYLLIYGRRSEANRSREQAERRANLARDDQFLMTYDRLEPQYGARDFITCKITKSGYEAMLIPPTISLGPMLSQSRAMIANKPEALVLSPYISEARKRFLGDRFDYWDDWERRGRSEGRGRFMNTGDWE